MPCILLGNLHSPHCSQKFCTLLLQMGELSASFSQCVKWCLLNAMTQSEILSMSSIIFAITALLTLGSIPGSLYSSLSFFWHESFWTVSLRTFLMSQSKVQLYLWWNRKLASFRFFCVLKGSKFTCLRH